MKLIAKEAAGPPGSSSRAGRCLRSAATSSSSLYLPRALSAEFVWQKRCFRGSGSFAAPRLGVSASFLVFRRHVIILPFVLTLTEANSDLVEANVNTA